VEQKKKVILALIIIAIVLAAAVLVYYTVYIDDDDDDDDNGSTNGGDDDVGDDDDDDDDITPPPDSPRAVINAPTEAYQFYEVTFDGSDSWDPNDLDLTYSWYFQNPETEDANTPVASYSFDELGDHLVTLAVQNTEGATHTVSHTITIVEGTGHPEHENLTLDEGNTGSIYKKAMGSSDDVRHWDMPEDVIKVEATLMWGDDNWAFRFSLGKGADPDTGTILVDDSSESGTLTVIYENNGGGTLDTGQWFVRIGILNEDQHQPVIEQCDFEIGLKVYYIKPE
jgi:hypothetical protein